MRPSLLAAVLAALLLCPAVARAASGGPDLFGYTWIDQSEAGIDPNPPQTNGPFPLTLGDDEVSAPISFGFNFPYYGGTYPSFKLSSNGWVTLDTTVTDPARVPGQLPSTAAPNPTIAWYWCDLAPPQSVLYWTSPGALLLRVVTRPVGVASYNIGVWIAFYQSGIIKMYFQSVDRPQIASIGIENGAGTDGLQPWYLGAGKNGFQLASDTTLEFFPPSTLDCSAPGAIRCGQTLTFSSPAAVSPNITRYGCSSFDYPGNERVIRFTNDTFADVSVVLSNLPLGVDKDFFFLKSGVCNEHLCRGLGADRVDLAMLPSGDYDIVVDGKTAADAGPFDLSVSCTPKGAALGCQVPGSPPVSGRTSGTSNWSSYPSCASPTNLDGPEFVYEVPFNVRGNLHASISHDASIDLDLLVFGPDVFEPPAGCVAYGDSEVTLFDPPLGTYYLVVEGHPDGTHLGAGDYQIGVTCAPLLDCAAPAGDLLCSQDAAGSTAAAADRVGRYSCDSDLYTGGEVVYRFHNDRVRDVSFVLGGTPGLSAFILPAVCDEGGCLAHGDGRLITTQLPIGDYFVVVDGKAGAAGPFTISTLCDTHVDPAAGAWTLEPGDSVHETKQVFLNTAFPRGDILFAMDLTGSMSGPLGKLPAITNSILNDLTQSLNDVHFGLTSFQDYPAIYKSCNYNDQYGDTLDYPYRLELPVTGDRNALGLAIARLRLGNGGDPPEAYARAWAEAIDDAANIGWRPNRRRYVVMIGDNLPHDCDALACGQNRSPSGTDPGRDAVIGTGDDLRVSDTMARLRAAGVGGMFLETSGVPSRLQQWQCWMGQAGGTALSAPGGVLPPEAIATVRDAIQRSDQTCSTLEARASAGFESWISGIAPVYSNVTLPGHYPFDFDLSPPAATVPGVYTFTVDFLCDGVKLASQDVTITVPSPCTEPTGSVGNNLKPVKKGDDVVLDWRGGALVPRAYNAHRETAKTSLSPPPSPPLGPVDAAETLTDAGAVPAAPRIFFYAVYGRDCTGKSIFK